MFPLCVAEPAGGSTSTSVEVGAFHGQPRNISITPGTGVQSDISLCFFQRSRSPEGRGDAQSLAKGSGLGSKNNKTVQVQQCSSCCESLSGFVYSFILSRVRVSGIISSLSRIRCNKCLLQLYYVTAQQWQNLSEAAQ